MSVLAVIALAAAPVAPDVAPAVAQEQPIVVIGKRLDTWRGRLVKSRGGNKCRTVRSTGDTAIDAIGCQAMHSCIGPVQAQLDAIIAAKQPKAQRQRRLQAMLDAQMPCLKETRDRLVADLADRRAGA